MSSPSGLPGGPPDGSVFEIKNLDTGEMINWDRVLQELTITSIAKPGTAAGRPGAAPSPAPPAPPVFMRKVDDYGVGIVFNQAQPSGGEPPSLPIVRHVTPKGPADRSGQVAVGDLLTHVGGGSVKDEALPTIATKLLGPEHSKVKLTLERDGKLLTIELTRGCMPELDALKTGQLIYVNQLDVADSWRQVWVSLRHKSLYLSAFQHAANQFCVLPLALCAGIDPATCERVTHKQWTFGITDGRDFHWFVCTNLKVCETWLAALGQRLGLILCLDGDAASLDKDAALARLRSNYLAHFPEPPKPEVPEQQPEEAAPASPVAKKEKVKKTKAKKAAKAADAAAEDEPTAVQGNDVAGAVADAVPEPVAEAGAEPKPRKKKGTKKAAAAAEVAKAADAPTEDGPTAVQDSAAPSDTPADSVPEPDAGPSAAEAAAADDVERAAQPSAEASKEADAEPKPRKKKGSKKAAAAAEAAALEAGANVPEKEPSVELPPITIRLLEVLEHNKYSPEQLAVAKTVILKPTSARQSGKLGDEDVAALVARLEASAVLRKLRLEAHAIGNEGADQVAKLLPGPCKLQELSLANNQISDDGCISMAASISSCQTLKRLDMSGNDVGDVGATKIGLAIAELENLEEVVLGKEVGDVGCTAIAEAMRTNPSLKRLSVGEKVGDEGVAEIAKFLPQTIESITLSGTIGADGLRDLFEELASRPSLKELHLPDCVFDDTEAAIIALLLPSVPSLRLLNLASNNIDDEGATLLIDAISKCPNLKEVMLGDNEFDEALAEGIGNIKLS